MRIRSFIIFLIAIITSAISFAQGNSTIHATVDKNRILIGEPLHLTVKAYIANGAQARFPVIDTIEHFEFLEKPATDTTRTSDGITIEHRYTITSFDSGQWVIPSYVLARNQSEAIPVSVEFTPFDPNQDYHDIKDIIPVKATHKTFPWWWYAGATLIVLAIIVWLSRRKKPAPVQAPTVRIDPYKEAVDALQRIQGERNDAKLFYTDLVDIFRQYVYRARGIHSQQKTTDDLVVQLRAQQLPDTIFHSLAQTLRTGDFVKFAKYQPLPEEMQQHLTVIRTAIDRLEQHRASDSIETSQ